MSNSRNAFRYLFIEKPEIYNLFFKSKNQLKNIIFKEGFINDLSATGCSIELSEDLQEKNSFFHFESFIKDKNYNFKTKIVWKNKISENKYVYGLEFQKNTKEEQERLKLIYNLQTKSRS